MGQSMLDCPITINIGEEKMSTHAHLNDLNRQLYIGEKITMLMEQSNKLIDIINDNQTEVNKLKKELEQFELRESNDITGEVWK